MDDSQKILGKNIVSTLKQLQKDKTLVNMHILGKDHESLTIVTGIRAKIWPELGLAALAAKQDRALRLWTLGRALDRHGSGRVKLSDLQETVAREGIKGLSASSVGRLLRDGAGGLLDVFTVDGERWVVLAGLVRLES